jgi:rSAM/selenodomain-associated transferase 1
MRRRPVVCVYVRAPIRGAVKRRLAVDIGDRAAQDFYRATTRTLLRRIAGDRRWSVVLCVTPDRTTRRGRFWDPRLPREPQGHGDLGARMAHTLLRRAGTPCVIVGSDIPDVDAPHIADAFAALRAHDLVFGPASDGGYWLIGGRDFRRFRSIFQKVRWSGPHALADTLANVPRPARIAVLNTLDDVDDGADFARLTRRRGAPAAAA